MKDDPVTTALKSLKFLKKTLGGMGSSVSINQALKNIDSAIKYLDQYKEERENNIRY